MSTIKVTQLRTAASATRALIVALTIALLAAVLLDFAYVHSPGLQEQLAGIFIEPRIITLVVCLSAALIWTGICIVRNYRQGLTARISPEQLQLSWQDATVTVPRHLIGSIVLNSDIVVLSANGVELARTPNTLRVKDIEHALKAHGYPEPRSVDPFDADFVPAETADVPDQITRLLTARQSVLNQNLTSQAESLRRQLASRGYMVRDVAGSRWERTQEIRFTPRVSALTRLRSNLVA